jgi:hypothetical protein
VDRKEQAVDTDLRDMLLAMAEEYGRARPNLMAGS